MISLPGPSGSSRWWRAISFGLCVVASFAGLTGPLVGAAVSAPTELAVQATAQAVLAFVYSGAGALITSRQPRNAVGWMLLAVGLFQGISGGGWSYGLWALLHGFPLAPEAVWLGNWIWAPSLAVLAIFLPLLFPEGRPLSPRWRGVVALAGVVTMTTTASLAVLSWRIRHQMANDMMNALVYPDLVEEPLPEPFNLLFLVAAALSVLALLSLVLRFRRSHGIERMQLKWFAFGGVTTAAATAVLFFVWEVSILGMGVVLVALVAAPVSVGVAVLRYRLYEIDRIVSRTVSYAVVTGVLVVVFAGVAIGLPQLFDLSEENPLLVAAATLAVAALFNPLRRRVQFTVDRRFNRTHYDALRTVEAFADRLRDKVDVDELCQDLKTVVATTVSPATMSLSASR